MVVQVHLSIIVIIILHNLCVLVVVYGQVKELVDMMVLKLVNQDTVVILMPQVVGEQEVNTKTENDIGDALVQHNAHTQLTHLEEPVVAEVLVVPEELAELVVTAV